MVPHSFTKKSTYFHLPTELAETVAIKIRYEMKTSDAVVGSQCPAHLDITLNFASQSQNRKEPEE